LETWDESMKRMSFSSNGSNTESGTCCTGVRGAREFRGRVSRVTTNEEFLEVVKAFFPSAPALPSLA